MGRRGRSGISGDHGNSDGGDHGSSGGSPGGAPCNHFRHTSFSCISSWTFYVENNQILLITSALFEFEFYLLHFFPPFLSSMTWRTLS